MASLAVVKDLDVLLDCPSALARVVYPDDESFRSSGCPEARHWRVVVAVSFARHRCLHAELRDRFAIVVGAILAATIRVQNQSWCRPLSSNGPPLSSDN